MSKTKLFFAILSCGLLTAQAHAHAGDDLHFMHQPSLREAQSLKNYAETNLDMAVSAFELAAIDLNGDGVNELILKNKECAAPQETCQFHILAESQGSFISLGSLQAFRLMAGDAYTAGVRSLDAFADVANDYRYETYVWEPLRSRYMIKK